eukprot:753627-Hanusia_phi.AAC.2
MPCPSPPLPAPVSLSSQRRNVVRTWSSSGLTAGTACTMRSRGSSTSCLSSGRRGYSRKIAPSPSPVLPATRCWSCGRSEGGGEGRCRSLGRTGRREGNEGEEMGGGEEEQ